MEPRIQYARTKDGVNIAYWAIGEGVPLVLMPFSSFTHAQLNWRIPEIRRWYELVGEKAMLVQYDGRGTGLSDRDVTDYSLDARVLDLEAVLARLSLERVALYGSFHSGPVAIAYAARHPERVSHLLLWQTWARASDYYGLPQIQGLLSLQGLEWNMFLETTAHTAFGWSEGGFSHRAAQFMKECVTQDASQAFESAAREFDTTPLLAQLECPTLVMHVREAPYPPVDVARRLAAQIPNARLALFEGEEVALLGDQESLARAVDDFLAEGEDERESGLAKEDIHTILFTDVEASTELTDRLGDARARDVLRTHERIVRDALRAHGGSEVKTMGDGFMASFSSATKALECAIAMQRAFEEHNETAEEAIRVRVGLNAGEPIAEEEDLFGTAVIVAARIAAKAEGGEIITSDVVRQLVAGKGFLFADRGDTALRGFEDPVRLYEVRWRAEGSP